MSTLIGTYEYVLNSGDMTFFTANWAGIILGINFIAAKIDSTGMLDVTATPDWGRTALKADIIPRRTRYYIEC
jgi:hypothetical protein